MSLRVLFVIASALIAQILSTEMSSCTDSKGIYPNVNYSINSYICEASPCDCILNCPALISVNFVAPRYLENIKPQALAFYAGKEIEYDLQQDDACDGFTNTQCPIVKKEKVHYQYKLNIPIVIPGITVTLRFSVIDEDLNEDVFCFNWDIALKKTTTCPP